MDERVEHDGVYWQKNAQGTPYWWDGSHWIAYQKVPSHPEPPPGFITVKVDAPEPPVRAAAPRGNPVVRRFGWILGTALLSVPVIVAASSGGRGYDTSYQIGRAFGSITIGLLLGVFVWRVLIHRSNRARFPKNSPWMLFIAFFAMGAVQLPATIANQARDASFADYEAGDYLVDLPGIEYRSIDAAALELIKDQAVEGDVRFEDLFYDLAVQELVRGGEVIGVIQVTVPRLGGDSFEDGASDYLAGSVSSAPNEAQRVTVDGTEVAILETPHGTFASWADEPVFANVLMSDGSDPTEFISHFLSDP